MKRTDNLTKTIAILLFLAFAVYIAVYAIHSLRNTTVTAEAVAADVTLGGMASGIVVREESVLASTEPYIDITAQDGSKVASGTPLATAMSSQSGLERTNRIHELELEISRISAALDELDSAADLTARDERLRSVVQQLSGAVARHELDVLDESALNLRSLLFSADASGVSETELNALKRELDSLRSSSTSDAVQLTSERSGIFSTLVDGYESLTEADLENLTPSKLQALMDAQSSAPDGAYGKLITSYRWYFAAAMASEDAAKLNVGRSATLNFGRYYGADITGKVVSISAPEDDSVAVVFLCESGCSVNHGKKLVGRRKATVFSFDPNCDREHIGSKVFREADGHGNFLTGSIG